MTRTVWLTLLTAAAAIAQPGAPANEVRSLNAQVLQLQEAVKRAAPAEAAQIRSQAGAVLMRRAAALQALIAQNPAEALGLAFASNVLAELASLFPQSAAALEQQGSWEGRADYVIADSASMTSHESIVHLESSGGRLRVYFANGEPPQLKCEDGLRVNGVRSGSLVAAADGTVTATTTSIVCAPQGEQRAIVLLVTFPGVTPPTYSNQSVWDIFFASTGRSVNTYWREASYGRAWATGDVRGWYTLDKTYTCDQYYDIQAAALRAADPDVDFRQYNRIFIIFPASGCGWAGMGNIGCRSLSSADGSFSASVAWQLASYMGNRDQGVKLSIHEGGHNLGVSHASSRDFGPEALGALGAAGTLSEYGDPFSTMGTWNFGHYAAPHKQRINWLTAGSNVLTVESNGTYSIAPMSSSVPGVQALKVRRGTGNNAWLWVEYRQPTGQFDSTLPSQVFTGALIHYEDSTTGSKTHLLDFTTGTSSFNDSALASGQSWTDPYSNVSLTVQPASGGMLNVMVSYGAVPCVTAQPTVSASPANPSGPAGASVNYTVSVRNNDSSGCPARDFSLALSQPAGWPATFASGMLTIAPGASAASGLTLTLPSSAAPGTYPVNAQATSSTGAASGTANVTVLAPPPPLSVTLTVPPGPYSLKSAINMSAKVLSGATPVQGAAVVFTLTKSNGAVLTKSVNTNRTGDASWSQRLANNDPKGTYSVSVRAAYDGQTASAGPVTFTVQ